MLNAHKESCREGMGYLMEDLFVLSSVFWARFNRWTEIFCAVVFLSVVLQHDYLLCCYVDLDDKEVSWWQNKYLFLVQGHSAEKKKAKEWDYLPLERIFLFYRHISYFWNYDSSRLGALVVLKEVLNTIIPELILSGEP